MALQQLFVPTKDKSGIDNRNITIAFRAIERWALGVGGIQEITSNDGTVTVTNPFGPITDLHAAGGGSTSYASLQGPGQTVTPGNLTQTGGFTITDTAAGATGISFNSNNAFGVTTSGFTVSTTGTVSVSSGGSLSLSSTTTMTIISAPAPMNITGGLITMSSTSGVGGIIIQETLAAGTGNNIQIKSTNNEVLIQSGGTAGVVLSATSATGAVMVGQNAQTIGFMGFTGTTRQNVSGSRGGNAALASLITILANHGLVHDSSSP